ncbi:hypothetical protein Agub_g240, partial [Astrephomene gubernaculifera]
MESDIREVPVLDIAPDQAKHEARQWLSTYRHLRTRVQAVTAELGSGPACEALKGRDFSEAASAASNSALQRLQAELWSQVDGARKAVKRINHLLSTAAPGSSAPVEALAAAIDSADQQLAGAREQQRAALEALYGEEAALQADIEAIANRLDGELEGEAARQLMAAATQGQG